MCMQERDIFEIYIHPQKTANHGQYPEASFSDLCWV